MPRAFLIPVSETEVLLQPAECVVVEEHHLAITTSAAVQRTEERDGREQKQLVACNQTHQLAQLVKREQPVRVGSKQAHGLFAEGAGTVLPRPGVDGRLQLRDKGAPIQRARAAEVECRNRERAPAWNRLRRLEKPQSHRRIRRVDAQPERLELRLIRDRMCLRHTWDVRAVTG